MSLSNQQLHRLNDSLDNELTDVYGYNKMLQDTNHCLVLQNVKLEVLNDILNKTITNLNKKINRGCLQ